MNIILLENIEKVGFKDEIVTVKNGYGRNFLIPQGKAILATESAVKVLEDKTSEAASTVHKSIYSLLGIDGNIGNGDYRHVFNIRNNTDHTEHIYNWQLTKDGISACWAYQVLSTGIELNSFESQRVLTGA